MTRCAWALLLGCVVALFVLPGCGRQAEVAGPPEDDEGPIPAPIAAQPPAGLTPEAWDVWQKAGAKFLWYGACVNGLDKSEHGPGPPPVGTIPVFWFDRDPANVDWAELPPIPEPFGLLFILSERPSKGFRDLRVLKRLVGLHLAYESWRKPAPDESLQGLSELEELRALSLPIVRDAGLAHIRDCKSLESLSLGCGELTEKGLRQLGEMKTLKSLKVTQYWADTEDQVVRFRVVENMTAFGCSGPGVTAASVQQLKGLKHLRELDFSHSRISDAALEHVKEFKELRTLELESTPITDAGVEHIGELKNLTQLNLRATGTTNEGLKHLNKLTKLTWLKLSFSNVTPAGLQHLTNLKGVTTLILEGPKVTDDGLQHLKVFPNLRTLNLGYSVIQGPGLVHLKELPALDALCFYRGKITDDGLQHVAEVDTLTSLELGCTPITDTGLVHLKRMPRLARLTLGETKITDAGLNTLKRVSALRRLSIPATSTTPEGHAKFLAARPDCVFVNE
jgi:internalin A